MWTPWWVWGGKRWGGREEPCREKIGGDKEELDSGVEVGADMGRVRPWWWETGAARK